MPGEKEKEFPEEIINAKLASKRRWVPRDEEQNRVYLASIKIGDRIPVRKMVELARMRRFKVFAHGAIPLQINLRELLATLQSYNKILRDNIAKGIIDSIDDDPIRIELRWIAKDSSAISIVVRRQIEWEEQNGEHAK